MQGCQSHARNAKETRTHERPWGNRRDEGIEGGEDGREEPGKERDRDGVCRAPYALCAHVSSHPLPMH